MKPSPPANAGSQVTPVVDAGWVGLYAITVNYGQNQVTAANIALLPSAPFIAFKLNTLTPGFSRMISLMTAATGTTNTTFAVPNNVTSMRIRLCGGGGGGGAGANNLGGGGGGGGGFAEGVVAVTPGQLIPVTIGGAGIGAVASGSAATAGMTSVFGSFLSATGGSPGASATSFAYGGMPGAGVGGLLNISGGYGSDGNAGNLIFPGNGGASFFGGGGRAANAGGASPAKRFGPRVRGRCLLRRIRQRRQRRPGHRHRGVLIMLRLIAIALLVAMPAMAQSVANSYSTRDGRANTVVITCPSQDGSYTAATCSLNKPGVVGYAAPNTASITVANSAVTVFSAGSVSTGCDIVNTGSAALYVDFTATAAIGSATSIPLQPGQAYHCPFPPTGAVSAIAAQVQNFVAVRY